MGVHLNNTVPKRQNLAERLRTAGCAVNTIGTDWHEAGDLTPPLAPGGGLPLGRNCRSRSRYPFPDSTADTSTMGVAGFQPSRSPITVPGDAYELDLEDAERDGIRLQDIQLPVRRLAAGKGVRVLRHGIDSIGQVSSAYFTIAAVGKTIDGVPIREELIVSKSG